MSYQEFAYDSDSLMDPAFYDEYVHFLNEHIHFQVGLELGCGTGEMTLRLIEEGKQLTATDLSNDMLEVLFEKAAFKQYHFPIYRMDMCDFTGHDDFEAVLCFVDSLNYIIEKDQVQSVFHNVYEALKDEGAFVFDVNSLYKHNVILDGYKEENDDEDFYFEWDVTSDHQGSITHHVVIEDKDSKERVEEIHHQRTFSLETYLDMLKKAGFMNIEVYSDFGEYHEDCERLIFICKKEAR